MQLSLRTLPLLKTDLHGHRNYTRPSPPVPIYHFNPRPYPQCCLFINDNFQLKWSWCYNLLCCGKFFAPERSRRWSRRKYSHIPAAILYNFFSILQSVSNPTGILATSASIPTVFLWSPFPRRSLVTTSNEGRYGNEFTWTYTKWATLYPPSNPVCAANVSVDNGSKEDLNDRRIQTRIFSNKTVNTEERNTFCVVIHEKSYNILQLRKQQQAAMVKSSSLIKTQLARQMQG